MLSASGAWRSSRPIGRPMGGRWRRRWPGCGQRPMSGRSGRNWSGCGWKGSGDGPGAGGGARSGGGWRRHPLTATGIIVSYLVFLAGIAGVLWQWRVAEIAADEKNEKRGPGESETAKPWPPRGGPGRGGSRPQATVHDRYAARPVPVGDDRTTAEQLRVLLARHIPSERMKDEGGRMNRENTAAEGSGSSFILHPSSFDLRGFEWHYCKHLLADSAAVFSGHDVSVVSGVITLEDQLVTLDENGQVRRWGLGSQVEDQASRRNLPGGPSALLRVLSPDGRLAALAQANKVRVFDTSTGKETCQIDSADDDFRRLIFSPDSARLVILDDKVRWLSAESGEVIAAVNQKLRSEKMPSGSYTRSLALSADGLTLAVVGHGSHDSQFSIFRLDETAKKVTPLAKDAGFNGTLSGWRVVRMANASLSAIAWEEEICTFSTQPLAARLRRICPLTRRPSGRSPSPATVRNWPRRITKGRSRSGRTRRSSLQRAWRS